MVSPLDPTCLIPGVPDSPVTHIVQTSAIPGVSSQSNYEYVKTLNQIEKENFKLNFPTKTLGQSQVEGIDTGNAKKSLGTIGKNML